MKITTLVQKNSAFILAHVGVIDYREIHAMAKRHSHKKAMPAIIAQKRCCCGDRFLSD